VLSHESFLQKARSSHLPEAHSLDKKTYRYKINIKPRQPLSLFHLLFFSLSLWCVMCCVHVWVCVQCCRQPAEKIYFRSSSSLSRQRAKPHTRGVALPPLSLTTHLYHALLKTPETFVVGSSPLYAIVLRCRCITSHHIIFCMKFCVYAVVSFFFCCFAHSKREFLFVHPHCAHPDHMLHPQRQRHPKFINFCCC
jgi:hypothetical protein